MDTSWFVAFLLFAVTTSISPGPNNLMLTASGLNFGFLRSLPHMLGIMIGFPLMLLAIGAGTGFLFKELSGLKWLMQWLGVVYFLWFAAKIALAPVPATATPLEAATHAAGAAADKGIGRPLTLWQAATFQWINVKAWIMAVGAVTVYWTSSHSAQIGMMALLFAVVGIACNALWTLFGVVLGRVLRTALSRRIFNYAMAALLLLSLVPIIIAGPTPAAVASTPTAAPAAAAASAAAPAAVAP